MEKEVITHLFQKGNIKITHLTDAKLKAKSSSI